jgi:predicted lipid-binding transport protein (Tim44 family)
MSRADNWITGSAVAVVAGVAGTAGWVSYTHALDVVRLAGETGPVAFAYPTFIDGMVYMSSMVLLSAARRKTDAPALAWWSLATGIALTLAANVYSMAAHGLLGAVAGALPAVALVLSYELLMWLIRSRSAAPVPEQPAEAPAPVPEQPAEAPAPVPEQPAEAPAPVPEPEPPAVTADLRARLNGHAEQAAELYSADVSRGEIPQIRRIRQDMKIGQPKAQQVRAYLAELAANPN